MSTRFKMQVKVNLKGFSFGLGFTSNITAVNLNTTPMIDSNGKYFVVTSNDTLSVNCRSRKEYCDTNHLLLYPQLDFPNYLLEISLNIDPSIASLIDGIKFSAETQNIPFTNFLVIFRYLWLGISFVSFLIYFWFYCRAGMKKLTFEHHFILILSISLFFFNDPIFAVTLFRPSIASAVFSTIFVTQFISFLILFWIIMWRRMSSETVEPSTKQINFINLFLGFLIFVMLTVACSVASVYSRFQPGVHANTSYLKKQSFSLFGFHLSVNRFSSFTCDWHVLL